MDIIRDARVRRVGSAVRRQARPASQREAELDGVVVAAVFDVGT